MPEPDEVRRQLGEARAARAAAARDLHAAQLNEVALQRQRNRLGRDGDRQALHAVEAGLREAAATVSALDHAHDEMRGAVDRLLAGLHEALTPEALTRSWAPETPILLLPLRVETRFKHGELLVRVFPDEIAVDTHEELLTVSEAGAGHAYWRRIATATTETASKEAWRKLVDAFGAPRSAYVARRTRPTNWSGAGSVDESSLAFPDEPVLKEDSWTQPPVVKVLPDRLVLTLLRGGEVVHRSVGELIPDVVHAGPKPLTVDGRPSWRRGADGRLVFDSESEWLRDFDTAVSAGLGFRLSLDEVDGEQFDQLVVLGLKHSADAEQGAALLEELLAGHRYSAKGLALVPQGTATNNTSDEDAGLDSVDWFADVSFAAEQELEEAGDVELWAASDGHRLAAYLGLDRDLFARAPHADRHDHAEAVAMNVALYPGTLGYFLRTMIGEVADDATLDELRTFYTRSVTGRGPLPALRVGNQPYGVVLAGPPPREEPERARARRVDDSIETVLARARGFWAERVPQLARLGATSSGSADLLSVLGLQPTAADYYQRIAVSYDHLSNLVGLQNGGDRMDDVFESVFAGIATSSTLGNLGYRVQRADGTRKPYPLLLQLVHQKRQTRIPPASLIDGLPFSETELIQAYDAGRTRNYIDWLAANARNPDALRTQDFGGAARPTSLLYLLMRHALLVQAAGSVNRWFKLFDIDVPELVTSRKLLGMTPSPDVAAWEILSAPADTVRDTVSSNLPLLALVQLPEYTTGERAHVGAPIEEMLAAYGVLRGLPTARLERLFAEHVDTLSYRLDAWETALTDRRLVRRRRQRRDVAVAQQTGGVYLGAVGYLENVRRAPRGRVAVEEDVLPESLREGSGDLYRLPEDSAGFIHAPSLNHATAAAVLRNGYLTHATPEDPDRLAVNLSSRRVRRAEELMDGVRNGQPLEVLLGIEFERGMHDATTRPTNPVVLNDLKPALRQAFPVKRTRIPRTGHPEDEPVVAPDFSVVNGLDLIAAGDGFPTGVTGLPALSEARSKELKAIRDRLKDSLDALKDVMTTETAYQLALGNFDRSAAVVQSLSAAAPPPEIEVTSSSRGTDLSFTQRLTIELDPTVTANPWSPIPLTPRAEVELPLNAWVGSILGDPKGFACAVTLTEPGGAPLTARVLLADLDLQPLDLLHVTRGARDAVGPQELEARIHAAALDATGASRDARVTITFADVGPGGPGVEPMGEALAMLDLAHQVISSARPIDGRDALTDSRPLPPGTEASGIAVAELRGRVDALRLTLAGLVTDLGTAVTAATASGAGTAQLAALRAVLRRAADAAVPFAFPAGPDDTLVSQAERTRHALETLLEQAAALDTESKDPALTPPQAAGKVVDAVHQLLGADFRVLPRFTAGNATDLAKSDAAREAILATARAGDATVEPVAEVLTSVAQVRPSVSRLQRLMLCAGLMAGEVPLATLQLPPRAGDSWLGAALPAGHAIADDTLSIIQLRPQGFSPTTERCGLLVDEWVESFPRETEVTGLAFNFDQPSSAPLQSLLLAVAGDDQQTWTWDGLLEIVRDTMLRARMRAVEPDMLDELPGVTTLLPATMAEFSTSPGALSLDLGLSVPAVFEQLKSTTYLNALSAEVDTP